MGNISHKKTLNSDVTQVHVEPPPNPLINSKHENKLDKDFVKLKLRSDPTS